MLAYEQQLASTASLECTFAMPLDAAQAYARRKSSDTLFILGSGSSVLELGDAAWQQIRSHDSVGFNFWMIHDFVPDFYFLETPRDPGNWEVMKDNLLHKRAEYRETVITFKLRRELFDYAGAISELPYRFHLCFCSSLGASSACELRRILRKQSRNGVLTSGHINYTQTASVDMLILWALRMKYERVVLCGIDMDTKYFYEAPQFRQQTQIRVPVPGQQGATHKTNDPSRCYGGIPVAEVIGAINDAVLLPRGLRLYTASSSLELSEMLPRYHFSEPF